MSKLDFVITGIGMRTAVGNSAIQTCASVRAGINRFSAWSWFTPNENSDNEEPIGVTASATSPDLGDEAWTTKSLALLIEPLHEAVWRSRLFDETSSVSTLSIKLYVSTPYIDRSVSQAEAQEESEENNEDDEESLSSKTNRMEVAKETHPDYRAFIRELENVLANSIRINEFKFFPHDQVGGASALAAAIADLESGRVAIAIVAGVDSLLHSAHLECLMEQGFLKLETNPTGLIPGEAAAVVILENRKDAAIRGIASLATIGSVELAKEQYCIGDDSPVTGQSLSDVLRAAVEKAGGANQFAEVMVDLNGQRARFLEWATVETRCMHAFPRGWKLSHPADCVGDVGAAFVPLAIGLVARSFERGYGAGATVVCCSSTRGERSAITVLPESQNQNQGGA